MELMEGYVQARGGNRRAINTGRWVDERAARVPRAVSCVSAERALQAKSLGTAAFHSELQPGLMSLAMKPESLRHQEILDRLEELGMSGSRATQIAALTCREDKLKLTPDDLRALPGILSPMAGRRFWGTSPENHAEAIP
ncbi:MAG: hypothetical protein ACR2JB_17265 [Bryobacteraceae bacterium]